MTAHPIACARVFREGDGHVYRFETSAQELLHPDGRRIVLMGLVHVAEPTYFEEVWKLVTEETDSRKATVFYEGVGKSKKSSSREMKEAQEKLLNTLDTAK